MTPLNPSGRRLGQDTGPTLTEATAELGVLVRVLGSQLNTGLSGYIVGGENTSRVEVEFDTGARHVYQVGRLQLYMPNGTVVRRVVAAKRKPIIPQTRAATPVAQAMNPSRLQGHLHPSNFVQPRGQPTTATESTRRRTPKKEAVKEVILFRKKAEWNF